MKSTHTPHVQLVLNTLEQLEFDEKTDLTVGERIARPLNNPSPEDDTAGKSRIFHVSQALKEGWVRIEEMESPTVPTIRLLNEGEHPVFVPAGVLLKGGAQTRVVAVPCVVLAGCSQLVQVRCVEAGRWQTRNPGRFSESSTSPITLKHRKMRRDVRARMRGEGRAQDQSETWREVTAFMAKRAVYSSTSSLYEVSETLLRGRQEEEEPVPEFTEEEGLAAREKYREARAQRQKEQEERQREYEALRRKLETLREETRACLDEASGLVVFEEEGPVHSLEFFGSQELAGPGLQSSIKSMELDTGEPPQKREPFEGGPDRRMLSELAAQANWSERTVEGVDLVDFEDPESGLLGTAVIWQRQLLHLEVSREAAEVG